MEKRGFWHSYGRSECMQNTFGSETEYSFFHENMELRIASFAAREPRRRRCRLRQTPCSYLLRQRSGNTAQQLDQTAYHMPRSDGGLLPPGADHFDRGAKKPWRCDLPGHLQCSVARIVAALGYRDDAETKARCSPGRFQPLGLHTRPARDPRIPPTIADCALPRSP